MKNNKRSSDKIHVFKRYRHSSTTCPSCGKPMVCTIKLLDSGKETQNLMYICTNPNCSQKTDIHQLEKSGWKLFSKTKE